MKPRVIIIAGAPGSGKGTQCKLLARERGFLHLSTGDVFRDAMQLRSELGLKVEPYITRGDFVPDELVVDLVRDRLSQLDSIERGVLLDGFPRTRNQARELTNHVEIERFVLIESNDENCLERIEHRRLDPVTNEIYNLKFVKPPTDYVEQRLIRRDNDLHEQTIRNRLRTFHAQLGLILPYFQGKIQVVNGNQPIDSVYQDLKQRIDEQLVFNPPVPQPAAPIVVVAAPQAQAPAAAPQVPKCAVCMDEPAEYLIVPCGHQCGCEDCLTQIQHTTAQCPICRNHINALVKVYQAGIVDHEEQPQGNVFNLREIEAVADRSHSAAPAFHEFGEWKDEQVQANEHEQSIELEITPCSDIHDGTINVSIKVQTPDLVNRTGIDVCCVVDISGSMADVAKYQDETNVNVTRNDGLTILDIVKHAVKTVIHTLNGNDRVSIVAFDDKAKIVFKLTELSSDANRNNAIAALESLEPGDSTNIWGGLLAGMESLRTINAAENGNSRKKFVLLLTDGQPNVKPPKSHENMLKQYLENYPDFTFQLHTFGFGYNLDSELLTNLSEIGNGTFAFIPDAKIVGTCFVDSVSNAASTLTQHAVINLMPSKEIHFAGPVLGNLPFSQTDWGYHVTLGLLQFGQSRDLVVPLKFPRNFNVESGYLEAVLVFTNSNGEEVRVSGIGKSRVPNNDSIAALARNQTITSGKQVLDLISKKQGQKAQQELLALCGRIATLEASAKDPRVTALNQDVAGRFSKALTTVERFNRWGKHYVRALIRAHQVQLCTNFMDPGLQVYGGSLFKQQRDRAGKVFVTLPPPRHFGAPVGQAQGKQKKPTAAKAANAPQAQPQAAPAPAPEPEPDMQNYYAGAGGGCFAGECTVLEISSDQTSQVEIRNLRKGSLVATADGSARVVCVVKMPRNKPLVSFKGGLLITGHHPIRVNGQWQLPCNVEHHRVENPSAVVYNVVLDRSHVLLVNGIECVTWGHEMQEDVVKHSLYGSTKIVELLRAEPGWNQGFVELSDTLFDAKGSLNSRN